MTRPAAPRERRCAACVYWDQHRTRYEKPHGTCHRFPPTPFDRGGNPPDYISPLTSESFWCGEFVSTPLLDPDKDT